MQMLPNRPLEDSVTLPSHSRILRWSLFIVAIYISLAFLKGDSTLWNSAFGWITSVVEVGLDILILVSIGRASASVFPLSRSILFLALSMLLTGDVIYNILVNVLNTGGLRGTFQELLYNVPYMFFLMSTAYFFYGATAKASKVHRRFAVLFGFLCSLLLLWLFVPKMNAEHLPWWSYACHFVCMLSKGFIVGIAIIFLIFGIQSPMRLISSGFLMIFSYSILLEFIEIFGTLSQGFAAEAFWVMGQAVIWNGIERYFSSEEVDPLGGQDEGLSVTSSKRCVLWDFNSFDSRLVLYGLVLSVCVLGSWYGVRWIWMVSSNLPPAGLLLGWLLLMILILSSFTMYLRSLAIHPLNELYGAMINTGQGSVGQIRPSSLRSYRITEIRQLCEGIFSTFEKLKIEKERNEFMTKTASQVSHDIRSPLAALRLLTSQVDQVPEDTRMMIQSVASRIHLIADTLIRAHSLNKEQEDRGSVKRCVAYTVIESIVSEKRLLLPRNVDLEFVVVDHVHGTWVSLEEEALGRTISNLLNNSVESFMQNAQIVNCRISIVLSRLENQALRVTIQDNAGGISGDVEKKIRDGMSTSTKASGLGLGLSYAKEMLMECKGRFEFLTVDGFGTVINLVVPLADPPLWFCDGLDLSSCDAVVVIDDDASIHEIWNARLNKVLPVFHFYSIQEAHEQLALLPDRSVYLVDYEFRGTAENGLHFIKQSLFGKKAYLVTSHYLDDSIGMESLRAGAKVLPKYLAPFARLSWARADSE